MNLLYFRRGSSDGVEKHFEDPQAMASLSDGSLPSQHDLAGLVHNQANHPQAQLHQKYTELTEDNSSSSESTMSHRSSRSNKSSTATPISDLATKDNVVPEAANVSSHSAHKKRTFFANIRKRKTSKVDKEKETK